MFFGACDDLQQEKPQTMVTGVSLQDMVATASIRPGRPRASRANVAQTIRQGPGTCWRREGPSLHESCSAAQKKVKH